MRTMSLVQDKEMQEALHKLTAFFLDHRDDYALAKDMEIVSRSTDAIAELDEEIRQTDLLLSNMERRSLAIRRWRNQCLPIYGIPPEILIEIFLMVQMEDNRDADDYYRSTRSLVGVSSHWLHITLSAPQIWAHLVSRDSSLFTREKIRRSGIVPLHIHILPSQSRGSKKRNEDFFKTVMHLAARWKSFDNRCSHIATKLSTYQLKPQVPLPLLEEFKSITPDFEFGTVPGWVMESSPSLHTLSIRRYSFPLHAPVLTQLRNISMSPVSKRHPFNSDEWNVLLSSCSNIEVIRIGSRTGSRISPATAVSLVPIHLPHLKSITFQGLPTSTISALLNAISTTRGTYPSIEIVDPIEVPINDVFDALFTGCPSPASLLALDPAVVCGRAGHQGFLSLHTRTVHSPPFNRVLFSLSSYFGSWLEDLEILVSNTAEISYLAVVLPSFRALQRLSLRSPLHHHDPVRCIDLDDELEIQLKIKHNSFTSPEFLLPAIKALSAPLSTHVDGALACPSLTYLTIEGPCLLEALTSLVEARYKESGGSAKKSVAPLKFLRLASPEYRCCQTPNQELFNQLESVLRLQGGSLELVSPEELAKK
ncbi:hypothetical protein FRC02_009568 [Tulasnella sp. 418]|nr:hypothetical protein FRC02_009568 [Tulasnella sp. 418]